MKIKLFTIKNMKHNLYLKWTKKKIQDIDAIYSEKY